MDCMLQMGSQEPTKTYQWFVRRTLLLFFCPLATYDCKSLCNEVEPNIIVPLTTPWRHQCPRWFSCWSDASFQSVAILVFWSRPVLELSSLSWLASTWKLQRFWPSSFNKPSPLLPYHGVVAFNLQVFFLQVYRICFYIRPNLRCGGTTDDFLLLNFYISRSGSFIVGIDPFYHFALNI